ncbi:hypothetical protein [Candidatus Mycobacterium methanotrophicum]|uniref:hypothetical protein n=1 Tax=Candidatus Mycobacterium methanotrophicum TaxID=2943498 RepID=UPI00351482EC
MLLNFDDIANPEFVAADLLVDAPERGTRLPVWLEQWGRLRRALAGGPTTTNLARDVNRATARTTYPVWTMNTIGDLNFHHAAGHASWRYRPQGSLFDQFLGAAEADRRSRRMVFA